MIDYLSYPQSQLRRVMHPTRRVALGVPEPLLSRYWRSERPDKSDGTWFLDPSDPAWDELLPMADALLLYKPQAKPAKAVAREREEQNRRIRRESYWNQVRALPGGMDPLWRYGSDGDDLQYVGDLHRYVMRDESNPQKPPWFPRVRLMMLYGTTSLREYARREGLVYPED